MSLGSVTFRAKDVIFQSDTSYTWYGELETPGEGYDGWISLLSVNGKTFGNFLYNSDSYTIHDLGGEYALSILDTTIVGYSCGFEIVEDEGTGFTSTPIINRNVGNCTARVLGLVSAAAAAESDDIEQVIRRSLQNHTIACRRSGISESFVRTELIGIFEIDDYEESDVLGDFTDFVLDDEFHVGTRTIGQLRDFLNADIVLTIYQDFDNTFNVAGFTGNVAVFGGEVAFSFLDLDFTGDATLAPHELGHLYTAQHEDCDLEDATDFCFPTDANTIAAGHIFNVTTWFFFNKRVNTVMYGVTDRRTIINYSNPNINYKGVPTGTDDKGDVRNNARAVREIGCEVSAFETSNTGYSADITGHSSQDERDWFYACECTTKTFYANASESGSTFNWSTSLDGINWTNIGGGLGANSANVNIPCLPTSFFSIRVIATSPSILNPATSTVIRTVNIVAEGNYLPSGEQYCIPRSVSVQDKTQNIDYRFSVAPNPSDGNFILCYFLKSNSSVEFALIGVNGEETELFKEYSKPEGEYKYPVNLNLTKGVYFCKLIVNPLCGLTSLKTYYK